MLTDREHDEEVCDVIRRDLEDTSEGGHLLVESQHVHQFDISEVASDSRHYLVCLVHCSWTTEADEASVRELLDTT